MQAIDKCCRERVRRKNCSRFVFVTGNAAGYL